MTDTVFSYGSFQHAANSVGFASINRTIIRGENQRPHLMRTSWVIKGKLLGQSPSEIGSQLDGMKKAYATDGSMATISGSINMTLSDGSLGGVRVTSPVSHGEITGAEGITYLRFTVGLEADYLIAKKGVPLSFSESVSFTDNLGGPIYVERIPQNGLPIFQQVSTASWWYATQSGKGSLPTTWPTPEDPIFGTQFIRTSGNNGRSVTYNSPKMINGYPVEYSTQWKYEFISPTPLIGWPNVLG